MHALVAGDQLVAERQAGHEPALLEPENAAKRTGKENAFYYGKGDELLAKTALFNPSQGPVSLPFDAIQVFDGVQQVVLFSWIFDVSVNEQRIGFGMDVLHHDLKTIKKLGFGVLNHPYHIFSEVFIDDPVAGRKEGKHVFDKMLFIPIELVFPVVEVLNEVYFFCRPEASFRIFVELPDVAVLYGEYDETIRVF